MKKPLGYVASVVVTALFCLLPTSTYAMEARSSANLKGIDVSHWNGSIDWKAAHTAGVRFAYIKAVGGTTPTDPMFATNVKGARQNGIAVGAYDYATPTSPYRAKQAVQQATAFVQAMKAGMNNYGDIMPVVDVEVSGSLTNAQLVSWVRTFINTVQYRTHRRVMIYTSEDFMQQHGDFNNQLKAQPLWVAYYDRYYGGKSPADLGGWSRWVAWQYSDQGALSGLPSAVDLDAGPTTLAALRGYLPIRKPLGSAAPVKQPVSSGSTSSQPGMTGGAGNAMSMTAAASSRATAFVSRRGLAVSSEDMSLLLVFLGTLSVGVLLMILGNVFVLTRRANGEKGQPPSADKLR